MKIKIRLNQILFFLIFAAFFALSFAYIGQYFFGLLPCNLCLYERKPFFAIIAICLLILVFFKDKKAKKFAILLSLFFLLINAATAIYHVGVEQKIFKLSESCNSAIKENYSSIEELKKLLAHAPLSRCDEPQFFFLGLSMAAWNIFYCLGLFIITLALYCQAKKQTV
jgi:disulfide bond formation protein DsbB